MNSIPNTSVQQIHHFNLKYKDDGNTLQKPVKGVKSFLTSLGNSSKQTKIVNSTPQPEITETIGQEQAPVNPFLSVISFLESLTYSYEDGRILVVQNPDSKKSKFQFLLLNPSSKFADIVKDARSVS